MAMYGERCVCAVCACDVCPMRYECAVCACGAVAGAVRARGVCMRCCCWCGASAVCVRALYATTAHSHRALCGAKKTRFC